MESEEHQARAFFGRRKGHRLRKRQAELVETLLPRLAIDLGQPAPPDLAALFPTAVSDVQLEIGFGGGENLIAQATARPQTGFIGVEPFVNGMAKALAGIENANLQNIRLHFDDATSLIAWLPDASLARIDLIHPDPWPKRRHWKRRFVQDTTIARLARILRPAASCASSPILPTTPHGRSSALCGRRNSSGPHNAPTIGERPGPISRAHAIMRKRRAKTGRRAFLFFVGCERGRARRLLVVPYLPEAYDALRR